MDRPGRDMPLGQSGELMWAQALICDNLVLNLQQDDNSLFDDYF